VIKVKDSAYVIENIYISHWGPVMFDAFYKNQQSNGKNLEVTINAGTQNGQILSANQYGMPNVNNSMHRGRLLMPIKINVPTNLTSAQKDLLSKFNNI
jgi:DnaJ-class molecular chaperone